MSTGRTLPAGVGPPALLESLKITGRVRPLQGIHRFQALLQTSCEQLKDVRENPAILLPDPTADIRAFRLTAAAPMGTKRNGVRKAFVPSINDAVEAFYARVVQGLRPTPPKMPTNAAAEAIDAVDRAVDGQLA